MKKTSTFQNGLIWFGAGVSLAEILTGTSFAPLGMAKGFAAILIGHIIGCAMMLLAGFIAYRLLMGVDTPVGYTLPDMLLTVAICVIAEKVKPTKA